MSTAFAAESKIYVLLDDADGAGKFAIVKFSYDIWERVSKNHPLPASAIFSSY